MGPRARCSEAGGDFVSIVAKTIAHVTPREDFRHDISLAGIDKHIARARNTVLAR
jgi:hypothetical protein